MSGYSTGKTSPWPGIVTVVMTLIGWSSIPLFLRYFATEIDVWTSNGWRYAVAAFTLVGSAKRSRWVAIFRTSSASGGATLL